MVKRHLGGIALCAALIAPAWAQAPTSAVIGTPPQPSWSGLSTDERTILAPLSKDWDDMENFRKKKWLGIADRYSRMRPLEQARVQIRMREWAAMTPEQRNKARDSYKEFTQLPPEKKRVMKQKWEAYSSLSPEERQRIKQDKAAAKAAASLPPPTPQGSTAPVVPVQPSPAPTPAPIASSKS